MRYFFYYRTFKKNQMGQEIGYWSNCLANSKKEVFDKYNKKGYARHVTKVYTEEQFVEAMQSSREKQDYYKSVTWEGSEAENEEELAVAASGDRVNTY